MFRIGNNYFERKQRLAYYAIWIELIVEVFRVSEVSGGVLERTKNEEAEFVQPLVLGDRLKQIRLSNNLTLADVSEMTGVARSTLSKIENHQLSPTFQVVQKLVEGLSIDIPQLFRSAPADAGGASRRTWTKHGGGFSGTNTCVA